MNRRTLFQALIGSAAASTLPASPLVMDKAEPETRRVYVQTGWNVEEIEPANGYRCYRTTSPKYGWLDVPEKHSYGFTTYRIET